ncbi:Hypothetical protein, putative [Bodo saltans]|uniref:Uncharacterized protein n=1 Tax=Bodo saltans TaxID=75058 RepID=A0A0S4IQ66_BODSA|nr:Hypothetical protein, putative [Bodo saltans]|eukprot:CUF93370.1 Hypothetical protein, putative [Bodo saltans]
MSNDDLVKENHRLSQLVRRMQDAVSTLRDEIADANSELAASRKLFDEQKQILLQELDRERLKRSRVESQLERQSSKETTSRGTNTIATSDASTSSNQIDQEVVHRVVPPKRTEFAAFCDWIGFTARLRDVDIKDVFHNLGHLTVEDVCANVCESDLLSAGVSHQKSKVVMQCIMECTMQYLMQ